jgi:hypothetical protein
MPVSGTTAERGATTRDADMGQGVQSPYMGQSWADQQLAEMIVKRQGRMEDDRALTESIWDLVDEFITSRRAVWDLGSRRGRLVGDKTGEKIYDQTTAKSGEDLADGIQSQSASPAIQWWAAHIRDKSAQKDYAAKKWIDEVQDGLTVEMAQSNYYEQLNEAYQDGVFMGNATMSRPVWRADLGKLVYRTYHPREIFYARDENGMINLWHRKFPMTNRNLADTFGVEKLDLRLRQAVEKNPFERRMVIQSLYLNTERDTRKFTSENKRIASVYVLENEKVVLRKSGFDEWPLYTWCWRLNSQEIYGRGTAMDSIFETVSMNSAVHYLMDAAQLAVQRPLVAQDELKGKIKISPYGVTWLSQGQQAPTELFRGSSEYPIGVDQVMKMRQEIREHFKADTFRLMSQLTQLTSRMNMMQIAEIQGEKAALLGPIVTRNQSELLSPQLYGTFWVLARAGRLPPPPPSLARYAMSPIDLEFLGPITVAQKRYLQMQGVGPFLERMFGDTPLAQIWPEMKDRLKGDELYDYIFETMGAPSKIDEDPQVVQQVRQQKAKMLQDQQQLEKMQAMAKGYKDTTQAPEEGSPAESAIGGQE